MAGSVLIDKLLATVIQLKASDLHITVGQPPVIRHHGRMQRLVTKTLDGDDTTALMKSITPDRCQQELQERRRECNIPFWPHAFVTAHCDIEQLLESWNNEYAVLGYGAHLYDELAAFCEVTGIKAILF